MHTLSEYHSSMHGFARFNIFYQKGNKMTDIETNEKIGFDLDGVICFEPADLWQKFVFNAEDGVKYRHEQPVCYRPMVKGHIITGRRIDDEQITYDWLSMNDIEFINVHFGLNHYMPQILLHKADMIDQLDLDIYVESCSYITMCLMRMINSNCRIVLPDSSIVRNYLKLEYKLS